MLSREDNNRLTQVGPDTPMGVMMRMYWHPIATSAELPHPDCDPLRARLLGEDFVVFRDTSGKVGVLDELCTHRGASMALGRVEEGGIRCIITVGSLQLMARSWICLTTLIPHTLKN